MRLNTLFLAAAALALGACTQTQTASAPTGDRDCFLSSGVRGYSLVDDRHVRVTISPNRTYLLTTQLGARDLDWSRALVLEGSDSFCTGDTLGVFLVGGEPQRRYQVSEIVREPSDVPQGS